MNTTDDNTAPSLQFTQDELAMLGRTADALSAYMGAVVLAEVGRNEDTEWVVFGRAIGEDEEIEKDVVHVQMGGSGTRMLGQQGGLGTTSDQFDCIFLWAVEITDDPDERFVRLDQDGEVFDTASELATLLPFSLQEPEVNLADEDAIDNDGEPSGDDEEDGDEDGDEDYEEGDGDDGESDPEDIASKPAGRPPTLH